MLRNLCASKSNESSGSLSFHKQKTAGIHKTELLGEVARKPDHGGAAQGMPVSNLIQSIKAGRRWLSSPQVGLGGAVPLEYALTEVGVREVENLFGRIEYGVYS